VFDLILNLKEAPANIKGWSESYYR